MFFSFSAWVSFAALSELTIISLTGLFRCVLRLFLSALAYLEPRPVCGHGRCSGNTRRNELSVQGRRCRGPTSSNTTASSPAGLAPKFSAHFLLCVVCVCACTWVLQISFCVPTTTASFPHLAWNMLIPTTVCSQPGPKGSSPGVPKHPSCGFCQLRMASSHRSL